MGDGDGLDEMLLETRLDGCFNFFDLLHELFDLIPGFGVEQRDPSSSPALQPGN